MNILSVETPLKPSRRLPDPPDGAHHSFLALAWKTEEETSWKAKEEIHFFVAEDGTLELVHFQRGTRLIASPYHVHQVDKADPESILTLWVLALEAANRIARLKPKFTPAALEDPFALCCRSASGTILSEIGLTPVILVDTPLGRRGTQRNLLHDSRLG